MFRCLTVFVAGLSEGFAFGENNGNNKILKAGDVEEARILKVLDVVFVYLCVVVVRLVQVGGEVADTEGEQKLSQDFSWNVQTAKLGVPTP